LKWKFTTGVIGQVNSSATAFGQDSIERFSYQNREPDPFERAYLGIGVRDTAWRVKRQSNSSFESLNSAASRQSSTDCDDGTAFSGGVYERQQLVLGLLSALGRG
jgi:hypothetical protein